MHDFDTALHKAHEWVHEMQRELGVADPHPAYGALRAGLHVLRDRLTVEESAQLAAQLPLLIRGLYYEGWVPARKPQRVRDLRELLDAFQLQSPPALALHGYAAMSALFRVLTRHLSPGEVRAVRHVLPHALSKMWTEAVSV